MYWGERMLGARTRTRRAAKRNEMERFRISEIKQGPHAPHTKRPPSATFVHVEHTTLELDFATLLCNSGYSFASLCESLIICKISTSSRCVSIVHSYSRISYLFILVQLF